jgi:hypothetical protein
MSVEDRLRAGLSAETQIVQPDTEIQLAAVQRRRRRRQTARYSAVGATAAAALIGATFVPSILSDGQRMSPARAPRLPGTYVAVVDGSRAAQEDMVGRWALVLEEDGTLDIDPPSSYARAATGAAYSVDGERLKTNALLDHPGCQTTPSGEYTWTLQDDVLDFRVVDDDCPARLVLFDDPTWERQR